MSGVWERLVKSVQRSLKTILGKDLINDVVLQAVFTEAERTANSRPLTRNSSSPNDDGPLTPSHFLNIRPTVNLPLEMVDDSDKFSRKLWRQAQLLDNHYWKRWPKEYIPSLQKRQKWHNTQRNLQTGELVLIADDNVPRHQWPIGSWIWRFGQNCRSQGQRDNIQKANHQDFFVGTSRFWRNSVNWKSMKQKRSAMNLPLTCAFMGGRNVVTFFTEYC